MSNKLIILALCVLLLAGCAKDTATTGNTIPTGLITEINDDWTISLPISGAKVHVEDRYNEYMPFVTDALIYEAEQSLSASIPDGSKSYGYYLRTDEEGYLCLAVEVIVNLEPAEEGHGGCGIDHDHVFYDARISTKPLPKN